MKKASRHSLHLGHTSEGDEDEGAMLQKPEVNVREGRAQLEEASLEDGPRRNEIFLKERLSLGGDLEELASLG